MDRLVIRGGRRIEGSVQVRGAKNAALPQIAAALLSSERLELANVPEVSDVDTMLALMREFGVNATRGAGKMLVLDASKARNAQAPYDMVRRMRASILVLAPLLARFGTARVSMPGGCAIGARPIDLHLKALEALGADVTIESGYINARADGGGLRGGRIVLSSPSVGASETAIMAASLDHALWLHRPFRADEWLLYAQDSPNMAGARGFARGLIFARDGTLVASVAQEGLVRERRTE